MYIYAAYDNNEEKVFSPGVGIDDQDFCKYFLSELTRAYEAIEKEDEKKTFKKQIKQCNLVRLGELNEDGSLVSDMTHLVRNDCRYMRMDVICLPMPVGLLGSEVSMNRVLL